MKWKCPECGLENSDTFLECTCGYAFYKMLGVKPVASREEVDQTYQYLKKVWDKNIQSKDPVMKRKARERMKKIEEAYDIYKQFVTGTPEVEKTPPFIKIASLAAIAIIILAAALIFFFATRKDTGREQPIKTQRGEIPTGEEYVSEEVQAQHFKDDHQVEETRTYDRFSTDITSLRGEEKAIELVKRSRGIDRFYSDELQISDWEAQEIDGQRYVVSFHASRGSDASVFYFDADIKTGSVRSITDRRELQRYGIQEEDFARYRLDVTVPEYVPENTRFEALVMITGKPNMKMPISEKMFYIVSNGCEVSAIYGSAPRRMSDVLTEYSTVRGTPRDPYIPSGEFIVLNSQGSLEIPVILQAGSYTDRLPRVGAGSGERGCIFGIFIGSLAHVETWVVVVKQ